MRATWRATAIPWITAGRRGRFLLCLPLTACGAPSQPTDTAPPLVEAASRGDLPTLNALLARGDSPHSRDACRWTPLMKASLGGHGALVERLLLAGAEVDAEDQGGYTALMLAASNNHVEVIERLLEGGAQINHQERTNGWTALIWAANRGHQAALSTLVRQGADPSLRDHRGLAAADWAGQQRHPELLGLLQSKPNGP